MLATYPSDVNCQGHSVIALCLSPTYKYLSPAVKKSFFHLSTSIKTLAPPLALDHAGDEALSYRDFSDAVLTPAADIVLSAVAVGVLRRQVRARWAELLGLLFIPSSSSSCGNYNSIFYHLFDLQDSSCLPKVVSAYSMLDLFCLHLILPSQFT